MTTVVLVLAASIRRAANIIEMGPVHTLIPGVVAMAMEDPALDEVVGHFLIFGAARTATLVGHFFLSCEPTVGYGMKGLPPAVVMISLDTTF